MTPPKPTLLSSLLESLRSLCGCEPKPPAPEPELLETIEVTGFDPDGEPEIKLWSDGSLWIYFCAMPPFFAEDEGTAAKFERFEETLQKALDVPVVQDDRELFVITQPADDTAQKAKAWLEIFHLRQGKKQ